MGTARKPLQTGVYGALTGDGTLTGLVGARVYDHPQENPTYPYVTIGDDTEQDFSTKSADGGSWTVTLHSWDQDAANRGNADLHDIMAAIDAIFHKGEAGVTVTGFTVVTIMREFSDVSVEGDGLTWHGVQRFRFLLCE
jgi:hypothetical protein